MLQIEILSDKVEAKPYEFKDKVTGELRSGVSYTQPACVNLGGHFPVEFKHKLSPDAKGGDAKAPGLYTLAQESFSIYEGRLQLRKLVLVPVKKA